MRATRKLHNNKYIMQNYYSNEHSFADKVEFWQVAGTITTVVTNRSDYLQDRTNRVL